MARQASFRIETVWVSMHFEAAQIEDSVGSADTPYSGAAKSTLIIVPIFLVVLYSTILLLRNSYI